MPSQKSSRMLTPLNTDIDRSGRTPEEAATRKLPVRLPLRQDSSASIISVRSKLAKKDTLSSGKNAISKVGQAPSDKNPRNGVIMQDDELWEFMTAFQNSLQHVLAENHEDVVKETNERDETPDNVERATQLLFRLFKCLSASEDETGWKYANSMDLTEFLSACENLCIIAPGPLQKKDAIAIFKTVNKGSSVSDYDHHEMNRYEFVKALDLIAKRFGGLTLDDLCFGMKADGASLSVERDQRRQEVQRSTDALLANVRDLSDLSIKMMKEILKIFQSRSGDATPQPQLDMDTFVDIFMSILSLKEREIQMLFMKIDVDSDGIVTWNEFSSFVLNLHAKVVVTLVIVHNHTIDAPTQL